MKRISLVLIAVVLISGCSRDGGDVTPEQTPVPSVGPTRTEEGVPGPLKPRASSSKDIDPVNHIGQEVFITDDAIVPQQLFAVLGATIRFVNETDEAVTLEFTNIEKDRLRIQAGAFAEWKPKDGGSVVIETEDPKRRGAMQIEAYYEEGETATPEAQD